MADGPRMRELLMLGFERYGWVPPSSLRARPDLARAAVAELEGRVVGVGLVAPADPSYRGMAKGAEWVTDRPFPDVAEADCALTALVVDPAHRRKGVGRALALARVEMAELVGAQRVFVHCVEGSGSTELYLRLGFEPVLRRRRHYTDGSGMALLCATLPFCPRG